ncbi:MAG: LysM peptidoglycan-binding domain-containing protein, partial [Bacteroidota bacterium]|nr:LysM peptidoglycan-binding domain-containing protein [Bacteroidota bacterium]
MQRFIWILGCFITLQLPAQDKLQLRGKPTDLYVVYTNEGTESLQDVSNQFGLSVAKISSYNKININTAARLPRGTEIKIPVNRNILLQHPGQSAGPVYYTVQKGETLLSISQLCYKVPVSKLRTWNQLRNDKLSPGMSLIVGFLLNAKPVVQSIGELKNETTDTNPAEKKVSVKTEDKRESKYDNDGSGQESKNKQAEPARKELVVSEKETGKTNPPKTENEKEKKWYSPS